MLSDKEIKFLELKANEIRQSIIDMLMEAGSGHTAGPLGMTDIFTAAYFRFYATILRNQIGKNATG